MVSFRGGAIIGWVNASGPLAGLEAGPEILKLSVLAIGDYEFRRDQVVSLQTYRGFLGLVQGIRIEHNHPDYPRRIVFIPGGAVSGRLAEIQAAGFIPAGLPFAEKSRRGVPFRWPVAVLGILVWNGCFLFDFYRERFNPFDSRSIPHKPPIGPSVMLGMGLVLLFLAGVRWIPSFRPVLLKPGRSFEELKHWVNLILLVLLLMLPMMILFRFGLWKEGF